MLNRRSALVAAAAIASLPFAAMSVSAQDKWPSKPVTIVVPFAAGGNTDVMARLFAEQLQKRLGQPFLVENKAGAGGITGLQALSKSTPDGYTIGVGTSGPLTISPGILKDKMQYSVDKDFTYLYGMAAQPNLWIVHPSVPANNMTELIAWLKANPDTRYATSGNGTTQHICGEMLAEMAGVKISPVAYRASNQSLQDLVGGHIKLACDNFAVAYEQVRSGAVRAVSVTSPGQYPLAKEVEPTVKSIPGFELMATFGWLAPQGLPPELAKRITDELTIIGKLPEIRAALEKFGVLQTEQDGPAYAAALKKDREFFGKIIDKAGIKAN